MENKQIFKEFLRIMGAVSQQKTVISLLAIDANINESLSVLVDQLERCQKALSDFLEEKRSKFPRFYFLGDDDLLQILGQSTNPEVIQTHLKKLYQGINKVVFTAGFQTITAIKVCKSSTNV